MVIATPAAGPGFRRRVLQVADSGGDPGSGSVAQRADCTIVNQRGLHARAAARFVKTAERFDASVKVFSRGQEVSGHSIMGLMMLAAGTGSTIHVVCEGREASEALTALRELVAGGFHEE
ncbi:HPr family phosphocarrier protein [Rhodospira trueperi]|uniref:Phosphocarrier protein n=1 Tax=Rhodospira trueperi TaxID=69960 RepID=A0A1G6WGH2_9PROT|nr:phosphocarrier protein [Rhodospira trueperi]